MVVGTGTALNVATVLTGSGLGLALGHRLPARTREVVTDALGLVTLLVAAQAAASVFDAGFAAQVGAPARVLIVLGALLVGGIAGSLLQLERRIERMGATLQARFTRRPATRRAAPGGSEVVEDDAARARFVQGFLTASLVFCVGPLTVLGSISDGLGHGIEQLALKSTLDGFASIAFAATLGVGVMASALTIAVVQGTLTLVGLLLGDLLPEGSVAALTATGGLLLVGVAMRLLRVRDVPVADLLPALVVAPLLAVVVAALR